MRSSRLGHHHNVDMELQALVTEVNVAMVIVLLTDPTPMVETAEITMIVEIVGTEMTEEIVTVEVAVVGMEVTITTRQLLKHLARP